MPLMSPTLPPEVEPREISVTPQDIQPTQSPNTLDVLRAAGVDQRRGKSKMSPLLVNEGIGLEECARKIANFANYSENEKIQYDAIQLALKLHGELDSDDREKSAGVQIVFAGVTPELLNVLIPR